MQFDIEINKLSKIEGHADLDIKIRNGKLEEVNLKVMENVRFFNQAVKGWQYNARAATRFADLRNLFDRASHGCIEAVEKTLGIEAERADDDSAQAHDV